MQVSQQHNVVDDERKKGKEEKMTTFTYEVNVWSARMGDAPLDLFITVLASSIYEADRKVMAVAEEEASIEGVVNISTIEAHLI